MTTPAVDVATLPARLDAHETLAVVDVRTAAEYETAHSAGAGTLASAEHTVAGLQPDRAAR